VPKKVATPAPNEVIPVPPLATGRVPVTPVVRGRPVTLVITPEAGVPRAGVTSEAEVMVGEVPNTSEPEPVSSVTAAARLAELGVPKKVATPVPRPDTPVLIGRPVALVRVAEAGVPRTGVTSVGEVANTSEPVPVSSVTAARRLAELGVPRKVATPVPRPDTPVLIGRPVALVRVAELGVPRAGVTSAGEVANTSAPEPVSSVTAAARLAELGVARKVATPVPRPDTPVLIGRPVTLVITPEAGVPRAGVTSVGEVANTRAPEPVSSVTAAARLEELGVARKVATPVPRPDTPVLIGRPVALVSTPEVGVPSRGAMSVGVLLRTTEPVPVDVVVPVPPLATGRAEASVSEVRWVTASTTFVALLNTTMDLPAGTAMPVPVVFFTVMVSAQVLLIKYSFSMAGTMRSRAPAVVPVRLSRRFRAICVALVSVRVRVTLPLAKVTSAEPVMASSRAVPRLVLVMSPHVLFFSPVTISSILRGLYELGICGSC
jgi:hypothetical protein